MPFGTNYMIRNLCANHVNKREIFKNKRRKVQIQKNVEKKGISDEKNSKSKKSDIKFILKKYMILNRKMKKRYIYVSLVNCINFNTYYGLKTLAYKG